ncbi:hypothetical protein GNF80_07815 [Clostridium perfringens]|nr:hypothetical protein [Clostridium perfringens]
MEASVIIAVVVISVVAMIVVAAAEIKVDLVDLAASAEASAAVDVAG